MPSRGQQVISTSENGKPVVDVRSPRIITLDDIIRLKCVDMDKFEVERVVVNKWEVGTAVKELERAGVHGTYKQKAKILVEPLFQVKVFFKQKDRSIQLMSELKNDLIADIKKLAKAPTVKPKQLNTGEEFMLEMGVMDLHIGKFTAAEETGEPYSIAIAEELFEAAVLSALADTAHMNVSKILWPVGNDSMHFDDINGLTTRGTPQTDRHGRYFQIYRAASRMYRWAIERCTEVAPVKFMTIPGNHDYKSVFHLGEELAAWYHKNKYVTFDNQATPRKYDRFGVNLIGFTHGNEEQATLLGALMAREAKADWAATSQHEWHLGHNHRAKIITESAAGVRVRWLPSLSAADSWHHRKGYIDRRSSEAYVWGKDTGYKAHFSFNKL